MINFGTLPQLEIYFEERLEKQNAREIYLTCAFIPV